MTDSILEDLRVLEYATDLAAAYCGKLLADLGAEVIKIEPPAVGDQARREGPFPGDLPHPEKSAPFLYVNTGKLSLTLNLASATGQDIFRRLATDSDVVVESTLPGTLEAWGLSYGALQALNRALILASITPFGQHGPHAGYKAYPLNSFHAGGEGYITPSTKTDLHRPPLSYGGNVGEFDCGVSTANAVLAALYLRQEMGVGQRIDVSKQEVLLQMNRTEIDRYPNLKAVETRQTRVYPFGGIMPCKDGYVEVIAYQEDQWQALMELMGNPGWAQEERFKNPALRTQHGEEVNQLLLEWLKGQPKEELFHKAQAKNLPFAPIYSIPEVVEQPQYKARQTFVEVTHPEAGKALHPTFPYRFSRTPLSLRSPAPRLGEHNEEILCHRLGYSKETLPQLRTAGVI